jgi:hypothetical protein
MNRKLLGGGLLTLMLAGCGGTTVSLPTTPGGVSLILNTGRVARAIEASILSQRDLHSTVSCPHNEPVQKGLHFVCVATTSAGKTPFAVTEVDNRGSTTYVGK